MHAGVSDVCVGWENRGCGWVAHCSQPLSCKVDSLVEMLCIQIRVRLGSRVYECTGICLAQPACLSIQITGGKTLQELQAFFPPSPFPILQVQQISFDVGSYEPGNLHFNSVGHAAWVVQGGKTGVMCSYIKVAGNYIF